MRATAKTTPGAALKDLINTLQQSAPYQISNQWFHDKEISLDGYSFQNCRFDNCSLHLKVAFVHFNHCFFSNSSFVFEEGAQRAVRVYNIFHPDHG